ncbi:hypothetical protein EYF80_015664 [Liparis tanakae]|uniref:Uncharacterized protein n=1 Tax=Liparis tanakae TaxID=230148 RepID=A0A4Z2IA61_9TELE|nr:hypothetical protein EYF80_015664 [Liparis tanakae]
MADLDKLSYNAMEDDDGQGDEEEKGHTEEDVDCDGSTDGGLQGKLGGAYMHDRSIYYRGRMRPNFPLQRCTLTLLALQ